MAIKHYIRFPFLRPFFLIFLLAFVFTACQKEKLEHQTPTDEQALAGKMTVTEIPFTATAMIAYCWGENIRFTGIIENHTQTVTTTNGNHYIRHFTVKGMTAVGVSTTGALTGTTYNVIGGAEMFSIKDAVFNPQTGALNLPGSLTASDIVIHRGNLVFENTQTGDRVVARHDILKVPGQGIKQDRWLCGGN